MDHFGFIHEELDIKILILFVLRRLPLPIEVDELGDLCLCDDGISYFDYSDCLSDLVSNENVEETEDGYKITEKGARNCDAVESSLPYSVRSKALKLMAPVVEHMRRMEMITAKHENSETGCMVSLSMSDGKGEIISLKLLCPGDEQAKIIEKNFRRSAEEYYQRIAEMLSEEKKKK